MSNYNSLKTTIDANIKQNGRQEITGQILNSVLNQMVTTLGAGYQFAGVATTATNPGSPDAKVFYIANGKGTYTNFGGINVTEDEVVVLYYDTEWHKVSTGIASQAKLTELESEVGKNSVSKTYTNADFANIFWGGDKWYASSSSYDSVIIPLYPGQTIEWNGDQYYNVKIFDYLPKLGDTRNFIGTIDNGIQTYKNETSSALYLYILRNPSQTLNMPVTLSAYGLIEDIVSLNNHLVSTDANVAAEAQRAITEESKINDSISSINDTIGSESLDKDFTEQDYSNLLWGGVSDGWIDASGQNYNSFIIPLSPSCTLVLSDIVGTINNKYIFDYEPSIGKKRDNIDSFSLNTYTNNTEKLVYVYIGWLNGQHSLHANAGGSGILKRLQDLEETSCELSGKTIVCFGDSITEFVERDGKMYSYPDYIREITNANVINLGIGGTQLRQRAEPVATPTSTTEGYASLDIVNLVNACCTGDFSKQIAGANYLKQYEQDDNTAIVTRASSVDWSKVDIVTILAGTNDWTSAPYPQGYGESGSKDKNLTLGAVNVIVETLLTAYPHLKIFYFTPLFRYVNDTGAGKVGWSDDVSYNGKTLKELSSMLRNEFYLNHIPGCDLYNELGWNQYNYDNYYIRSIDLTHPYKGFYNIARRVVAFLQANRNF